MYPKIPLKNILKLFNWYAFKKSDYKESGILLIRQTNLDWNNVSKNKAVYVDKKFLEEKKEFILKEWDILIWMSWNIWKFCFFDLKEPALQNQRVWKLSFSDKVYSKFVLYYLPIIENQLKKKAKWVAVLNISWKDLEEINIPLPPLPTQHLIVQEIEKQFSRLDEWLASLKRTKENLKKYKASVLKSAVEWKLTEEWRKEFFKDPELVSGWQLLNQILQERKEKFLAENPWKKYKEPEAIKKDDLPNMELPEGWEWSNVNYITRNQEYWSSQKADLIWDVPVLRMWNIQDWKLDFWDLKYFKKDNSDIKKLTLEDKELLFCRTNWSPELVWKTALYYKEKHPSPCSFAWYLIRVWTFNELFKIEYLYYCLNSVFWRDYINRVKTSINQNNVSWEKLSNYIFPLPPLPEQNEIVKIVESKLSVVEKLEKIVNDNIRKAENLKQSILKKAFEWKLVKES